MKGFLDMFCSLLRKRTCFLGLHLLEGDGRQSRMSVISEIDHEPQTLVPKLQSEVLTLFWATKAQDDWQ